MSVVIKGVHRRYGQVHALNNVNLELGDGDQYAIRGPSGSGKSTLLYLLAALDKADKGEIYVDEFPLHKQKDHLLAQYRNRKVGLVFQSHFLLPSMTCLQNILLPAKIGGVAGQDVTERVEKMAQYLGVADCLMKYPYQVSGGQQQRVNIIRALSLGPKLLLCDEPTGNLDSKNSQKVAEMLGQMASDSGATLVVVTHDEQIASYYRHQLYICDGLIST